MSFAAAVLGALLKGRPDSQRAVWADFLPAPGRVVIVKEAGADAVDIGVLLAAAEGGGDALHAFRVDAASVQAMFLDSPEENIQHMVRVLRACGHAAFKVVPEPDALRLVSPDKIQLKLAPLASAAIAVDATTAGFLASAPHGRSTHFSPVATTAATATIAATVSPLERASQQQQQLRKVTPSLSSSSPSQVLASSLHEPTQELLPAPASDATAAAAAASADATLAATQGSPAKAKPLTRPPPKAVLKTAKRTRR